MIEYYMKNTCALIVTYYPDEVRINNFISDIIDEVNIIIIVDNTPEDKSPITDDRIVLIRNHSNKGIAHAQNQGIFEAIKRNVKYLFFFDQDSDVNKGYFSEMLSALTKLEKVDKVSAIGPNLSDKYSSKECCTRKDFLISSGTLSDIDVFREVGLFNSGLFIDMVDIDWCHRARKYKYNCYVAEHISMKHNVGENNYPKIFGKEVRIGSPIRQYYLVRNWILCIKSDSFDMFYKIKILYLMLKKIPLFMLCVPRKKRIKYIFQGVLDGLSSKIGIYSGRG